MENISEPIKELKQSFKMQLMLLLRESKTHILSSIPNRSSEYYLSSYHQICLWNWTLALGTRTKGHRALFIYFRLFFKQSTVNNCCRWPSRFEPGPLVSEWPCCQLCHNLCQNGYIYWDIDTYERTTLKAILSNLTHSNWTFRARKISWRIIKSFFLFSNDIYKT